MGQGSLRKCLVCTAVWHEECLVNTDTEVCSICVEEQVEASEESKRWVGYLKTQVDRPRPPAAKTCLQVVDRESLQDLGPPHDSHDSWCQGCDQGGDLLCCDHCTLVWHLECVYPAISKVPGGKWACPHCAANGKPKPKSAPRSKPAKRKSSTKASLLKLVPGGLSFKQQLQLAMSQSKREEEVQQRRMQRQRKSQSSPPSPASNPESCRYKLLGAPSMAKKRRLNKTSDTKQTSSKFKSDIVQSSNGSELPRHPQSPDSTALSDALSRDTVEACAEEDFGLGKFIIHEAAEKVELDGFSICVSNEAS